MRKDILVLGMILGICTTAFSAEEIFMKENLDISIKRKPEIVAYMKDVVNISSGESIIEDVISPNETHHDLNFENVSQQIFGENCWLPKQIDFDNPHIEEILSGYKNKMNDMDDYSIFLANLLYASGSQFYTATKNSEFLEYAASMGHAGAQYKMFPIALKSKKYLEAKNYLLSAAAQKHPEALLKLSDVYQGGYHLLLKGFSKDLEMSKNLCEESALLGNDEAMFRMGVATLTEGFFGCKANYQEGILKAKELATLGNKRAEKFIDAIMNSSADSLMEGNDLITQADLDFLKTHLGWENIEEMS